MSRRRSAVLLLLALLISTAGSEDDPKPTVGEIEVAKRELQTTDLDRLQHRFNAAKVAARSQDPSLVQFLFQAAISCKTPALAVAAGEAANKIDPNAALKLYDAGKGRRKGLTAANAVRFLGEIRARGAGTRLADAAKAQSVEVRVEALYGIVKQEDPALHIHLTAALKMRDAAVRVPAAICCGLAKVGGAVELLLRGLDKPDEDYAYFCAWALGQMEDPGVLAKVVNTSKGRMAGAAGIAKAKAILECAKDPQHIEILIPLTRASNEDVAGAACTALGGLAKGHVEATDALLAVVNRGTRSPLSHLAADALGRVGEVTHGEKLTARYKNNPGKIQAHAVRALGLLKDPGAAPLLLQLAFRNKSIAIQKRAAFAFWQCADEKARASFRKKLLASSQGRGVALGCAVLGFNRSKEGFELAVELLRKHYAKKSQKYVRAALERMTGHRFSPSPAIWKQWFAQNADFFQRKPQLLNREEWRKKLLTSKAEMGISKKTEAAVERGLAWLARHQNLDGRWSGDKFTDRCKTYYRKKCQVGARFGGWDVGMTGIALLSFYAAGYRPHSGRYKDTVLRAQVFTAARQRADGDFGGQGDLIGGYTRPVGTIALAEAYGTTADKEFYERAWRSAAHLVRIQYDDAGWRYRLGGQFPGDTSVTGWNAWAIATARKIGIPVDPMGLEGSNSLIDMFSSEVTQDEEFYNTDPRYFFEVGRGQSFIHFTGYNAREASRPPMTAIGLICKIFMGRHRSHPYCIGAANRLLQSIPEYDAEKNAIKYTAGAEYPSYYWYYGSLAMYQMGGRFWRQWSRPLLTEGIPNIQIRGDACEHGSWDSENMDSIGGRIYATCMCVLTLETFYRYLPALRIE
ncbi:MAG: hypothetical protein ACYSUN_00850 [Planctomycetota bacterium]|jgi:HEAT repeat protein